MNAAKSIEIALRLQIADFSAKLGAASAQARAFSQELGKAAQAPSENLTKAGTAALVMGGSIVAGFGLAVHAAMGFDKQMSEVGAVSGATGEQLAQLRQAAIDAGAATVFSAGEAAQAEAELAKVGVSTADILGGGLTGALNLASAGQLELGNAAEIAAQAMTTFGLSGSDVPRIADTLAAAANKSAADVSDMAQAIQQSGLVAAQLGLTIEDTAGVLALFAQNGLRGSDAGTSLKTMLMRLNPSSKEAAELMEQLGISFFDAQGQFIGIQGSAEMLQQKLGGLTQEQRLAAETTLFGADAIRAANILYQAGGEGVKDWTEQVTASGYAADLAAQKNDNLAGDLEQLRGSLETALIQGGSMATDVLRGLTQTITTTINGLGEMPAAAQVAFLGTTGLIGLGTTAIGLYGTLAPKFREVQAALEGMGSAGQFVGRNLGAISIGAIGAVAGLGLVSLIMGEQAKKQQELNDLADKFAASMKAAGGAVADIDLRKAFADSRLGDILKDTGANIDLLTDAVKNSGTELDDWANLISGGSSGIEIFEKRITSAAESGSALAGELLAIRAATNMSDGDFVALVSGLDMMNDAVDKGAGKLSVENQMLGGLADGADGAKGPTDQLTGAAAGLAGGMEDTAKKTKEAVEALKAYFDAVTAPLSAAIEFEAAIDSLSESIKEHGNNWSIDTEAGRANTEELIKAKDAAIAHGVEVYKATGSTDAATKAAMDHTWALAATMSQAGMTDSQIQFLLTTMGLTPEAIATQFNTPGLQPAQAGVADLNAKLDRTNQGAEAWIRIRDSATGPLNAIEEKIRNLPSAQIPVGLGRPSMSAGGGVNQAHGGIVEFYGSGGFYEPSHLATIVPQGTWRISAEPETQGEAYIPLAHNKRARSMAVLGEVANRFGVGLGAPAPVVVHNRYEITASAPNYLGDVRDVARALADPIRDELRILDSQSRWVSS